MPATTTPRTVNLDTPPTRDLDLTDPATRRRLTASAVPAILALTAQWRLTDQQSADLLGGVSVSTVRRWRRQPPDDLGIDGLTRASYLLGIYRALHVILDDPNADAWFTTPNSAALFGGRTPLAVVSRGGLLALDRVRTYLDAVRGGR